MKDIEKAQETLEVFERKETIKKIDECGNIKGYPVTKMYVCDTENSSVYTKSYFYLEWIDNDTFIFGDLSFDPVEYEYTENRDIKSFIRYGILKLIRDRNGNVIPMQERIVVQPIYNNISQDNDKTVNAETELGSTYFDYEKETQLVPAILKFAGNFNVEYEGFARCSISETEDGYLPRNMKPVNDKKEIRLLSEEQVKLLIEFQEKLDKVNEAHKVYRQLTGTSYSLRKKYD